MTTNKTCANPDCTEPVWNFEMGLCRKHSWEDIADYFGHRDPLVGDKVSTGDSQLEAHAASGREVGHPAKETTSISAKSAVTWAK